MNHIKIGSLIIPIKDALDGIYRATKFNPSPRPYKELWNSNRLSKLESRYKVELRELHNYRNRRPNPKPTRKRTTWRERNSDQHSNYNKNYYEKNKTTILRKNKNYYEKNKTTISIRKKTILLRKNRAKYLTKKYLIKNKYLIKKKRVELIRLLNIFIENHVNWYKQVCKPTHNEKQLINYHKNKAVYNEQRRLKRLEKAGTPRVKQTKSEKKRKRKLYLKANKEHIKVKYKEWIERNREQVKERLRKYRELNREKLKIKQKERDANKRVKKHYNKVLNQLLLTKSIIQ